MKRLTIGELSKAVRATVQKERAAGTVMSPNITPSAPGVKLARARAVLKNVERSHGSNLEKDRSGCVEEQEGRVNERLF